MAHYAGEPNFPGILDGLDATDAANAAAITAEATARAAADTAAIATAAADATSKVAAEATARATAVALKVNTQTATTGKGPKVFYTAEATFNGTVDPVTGWGYNTLDGISPVVAGEPHIVWHVEGDYNDGTANRKAESYLQYWSADSTVQTRPLFFQIDKTTNRISATWLAASRTGTVDIRGIDNLVGGLWDTWAQFAASSLTISPISGSDTILNIASPASPARASMLKLGYNGVAAASTYRTITAGMAGILVNSTIVARFYDNALGGSNTGAFSIGVDDNSAAGCFKATAVGVAGVVARAFSSGQTADLFAAQDSSSVVLTRINKNGYLGTRKGTVPADAEVATGEVMMWFDPTNGASKVMFKGKQADGTVKTASVALA